jgi:D-tyrosyl-tRNA(Tyr) deacylase
MRAVVQRVKSAAVEVDGRCIAQTGTGFLVLVCVMAGDTQEDLAYIAGKLVRLRVFEDENGKMNLDIRQTGGQMLIVSQFTLAGDARHGNRPGFSASAAPQQAQQMYLALCDAVAQQGVTVEHGQFGADMQIQMLGDGPVTILLDSTRLF